MDRTHIGKYVLSKMKEKYPSGKSFPIMMNADIPGGAMNKKELYADDEQAVIEGRIDDVE